MLNKKLLIFAGLFSAISAIFDLLFFIVIFLDRILQNTSSEDSLLMNLIFDFIDQKLISLIRIAGGIYVLIAFKHLLNKKASFHHADNYILIIILLKISNFVFFYLINFIDRSHIINFWKLFSVVDTITNIIFALALLKCKDNFFGFLKPFALLTITEGVLLALEVGTFNFTDGYGILTFGLNKATNIIILMKSVLLAAIFFKSVEPSQT